jgi:hypothetical protein
MMVRSYHCPSCVLYTASSTVASGGFNAAETIYKRFFKQLDFNGLAQHKREDNLSSVEQT